MEGKIMLLQQAIAYISRKERGIWFSFWFSSWSSLACISVFFTGCKVGERLEDHIKQSAGTSFALTSKQGATPFALKEAEKVQQLAGVGLWFLNMKVPFAFLVKKRWRDNSPVEQRRFGAGSQASARRCLYQKTDQHLDFPGSGFQLVQGKHLSDKAPARSWSTKSWLRRTS